MNTAVIEIMRGVRLTCVTTDKFKTGCLSVTLLTQLGRETASQNALIPSVLRRGTARFPDMDSLAARLDELYGAQIEPAVRKKGELQCVGFFASFADDAFVPAGVSILENVAGLMCEMLLTPNTRGGLLLPDYVNSEKEKQLEFLRARINDKRSWSILRLFETMCFAEDYAVDRLGDEAHTESINYQKLTKHYRELLGESPVELFYCGSAQPEHVASILRTALSALPRTEPSFDLGTEIRLNSVEEEPRYFEDCLGVTQGKLAIGFRLGECMANESTNLAAIRVFNALYGGCVTSKLFENVRERLSLCYFASSMIDRHKGLLVVSSGIEFDKYEQAKTEILAQLDAIRNGEITADELLHAKKSIASDVRAMLDSQGALEDYYLAQGIDGGGDTIEEHASAIELITKDEVIKIARGVECDCVYFLRGLEKTEDAD